MGMREGIRSGVFLEGALLGRPESLPQGILNSRFNLYKLMSGIRERQTHAPQSPDKPILKALVTDIADFLDTEFGIDPDRYEVRVYSAVDTPLDRMGVDFWFELVDLESNKIVADYKVDLTTNEDKIHPGGLADYVYHYDTALDEQGGPKAVQKGVDYKALVEVTTENLFRRSGLPRIQ